MSQYQRGYRLCVFIFQRTECFELSSFLLRLKTGLLAFKPRAVLLPFYFMLCAFQVKAQDLKLWYKKPAEKWTDALPVGNGRLGAMIYGGVGRDHIQFNEETLWTGGPRMYSHPGAADYLPQIRQLLFEGKQEEAEKLAEEKFMGLMSPAGDKAVWLSDMRALKGMRGNPSAVDFDDSKWKDMKVPTPEGWENYGWQGLDGAVWLRTSFVLPEQWEGKNLVLDLGKIRDQDFTYVNGKLIGSTDGSGEGRKYTVPANDLRKGRNVIAIQVLNYYDKGGLVGYKDPQRTLCVFPQGADESSGISLNKVWKYFIQNDEPPEVARYEADYQPFGDLWLNFEGKGNFSSYRRELDLKNAVVRTDYSANGVIYTREYFASQPNQAIVIHLSASKTGKVSFTAILNSLHKYSSVRKVDEHTIALRLKVRNGVLEGESYLRVEATKGSISITPGAIRVKGADEATLYLTAGTNYVNYKDVSGNASAACKKALTSLSGKSWQTVKDAHIREYQRYFNTFSISLGKDQRVDLPTNERLEQFSAVKDPAFAALYMQYGRYLLISSSRPGTNPANLQGIWNDQMTPPWGSKYTTNINLEMNYWPAEELNLSPMTGSLFDMIDELRETGAQTAKMHYNAPGWVLHHNTDLWRGTAPINASNHGIWVSGAAWLCHHLWEHYLYTQDREFLLKRAYPAMKDAALFFNSFLVRDPKTGWLISTPSNSPEQGGLVAGPTMDHQIIRDLFENCIEAASLLQTDGAFADTLRKKYKQIAPGKIGKYGQLQEWMEDKDDTTNKHRHVSHLWGVYPGNEITWEHTPDLMKAARQSLIYRGDAATGWSLAWKINLWARFLEGDHALKLVEMLLSPAEKGGAGSYLNLFDAHPPFQIDGNFGGAAGIAEMLLQSQNGYINILPALPSAFSQGEIKGICARGGFELDFSWKDGKLTHLEVRSKAGNKCVIHYRDKEVSFQTVKGGKYILNGELEIKA